MTSCHQPLEPAVSIVTSTSAGSALWSKHQICCNLLLAQFINYSNNFDFTEFEGFV